LSIISIEDIGLTPVVSFDRLGNQTKYVKQLHHHFDNQLDHGSFERDFSIDLEAVHELSDQLK
jgi:hypothetical protein